MVEYSGSITHSLDDKGRVAVPKPLLDLLIADAGPSAELAITYGADRRLYLIPSRHLSAVFQHFITSPFASKKLADLQSYFFGTMHKCVADKQGRVMLPPHMLKYAKFSGNVTFVGAGNRIELWEPSAWDANSAQFDGQFGDAAREAYASLPAGNGQSSQKPAGERS